MLPPDVHLDADADPAGPTARLRHPAARPVWYGVVWGRLGRGDLAWTSFDRVAVPELQPWIAAERGRILRELGHHDRAEALEWPALAGAEDPVDAAMLRISLAANAVGFGDHERATSRWHASARAVAELPDGPRTARQRLRLTWVGVEVAGLHGEPLPTEGLPTWSEEADAPQLPPDHAAGSTFHTAKGLLFAGVVHADLRLLDAAAGLAPPALLWAVHAAREAIGVADAAELSRQLRSELVTPPR